jgi:hypothetical protein
MLTPRLDMPALEMPAGAFLPAYQAAALSCKRAFRAAAWPPCHFAGMGVPPPSLPGSARTRWQCLPTARVCPVHGGGPAALLPAGPSPGVILHHIPCIMHKQCCLPQAGHVCPVNE